MRFRPGIPTIATFVEPNLRSRLDAASSGTFYPVHANTLTEVVRAVKERPVSTILLSPHYVNSDELSGFEALVRNFPAVSAVAVVGSGRPLSAEKILGLGASGIKKLVDLCDRNGWGKLRAIVSEPVNASITRVINELVPVLGDATPGCRMFFEALVRVAPEMTTVRKLCRFVSVHPSTIMSRFLRAGLPSPRDYLSWIRLVHAAVILEDQGLSLADVAYRLEHSSPQSFGRHVKALIGCTAGEFRDDYDFETTVKTFSKRMVVPYRTIIATFEPLPTGVKLGQRGLARSGGTTSDRLQDRPMPRASGSHSRQN